ncbi:MAG: helix-hairpin-helix domain-containing protein [Bacteroidota bacterium]
MSTSFQNYVVFRVVTIVLVIQLVSIIEIKAQVDTLDVMPDDGQLLLEDLFQNVGDESGNLDFNTIYENLSYYAAHPIPLNRATRTDLQNLQLLSDIQINNLLKHREQTGDLLALYELQAIAGFDAAIIQQILPYVTLKSDVDDYRIPINEMLARGQNRLYLRLQRQLQLPQGFSEELPPNRRFVGDPNRLYVRYKHNYENRFQYGVTMEKDAGEAFGRENYGFDFYSVHAYLKNYNKVVRAVAIGDFAATFGQGLILNSGFGYGKTNLVMDIKKTGNALRPYSGVSEIGFLRGAGATLQLLPNLQTTFFASLQCTDGNLITQDTLDGLQDEIGGFSSLLNTGFHRTLNEIAKRNTVQQLNAGASIRYEEDNWHIALNGVYDRFSQSLQPRETSYNRFFFRGDRFYNLSADYAYIYKNVNFFGETARDANGAWATLNAALIALDRKVDLAVLYRHYQKDYNALQANGFGESVRVNNEEGIYLGMIVRPSFRWEWSGYFDVYRHPWLRFRSDSPSHGYDWRMRLRYYKKRDWEIYLQARQEVKLQNLPNNTSKVDELTPINLIQARLHFAKQLQNGLELRTRFDWGTHQIEGQEESTDGYAILQDVIFKPRNLPFSFTTRYVLFDTDGFATRFYHFENNLTYTFAIPAYYNRGSRFYFNIRYRGIRNLVLEARYEQTFWNDRDQFSTGLNAVEGQLRSAIGAQVIYRF